MALIAEAQPESANRKLGQKGAASSAPSFDIAAFLFSVQSTL